MLLAPAATKVIRPVPMTTSGSRINSSLAIAGRLTSSIRPMPVAIAALPFSASRISSSEAMPIITDASILPLTMAPRAAGVASNGSSDCRSRSPAVVSIARWMPPRNAEINSRIGSIADSMMPRLASGVARSRVPTPTGTPTTGLIPRASMRNAPRVCEYCLRVPSTRATGTSALRRVESVTSSTLAGTPECQSFAKSGSMTRPTSSFWLRTACSTSATLALRALIPWLARCASRLGACSLPATGMVMSFSSWVLARFSISLNMPSMIAGNRMGESSRVIRKVRRSR